MLSQAVRGVRVFEKRVYHLKSEVNLCQSKQGLACHSMVRLVSVEVRFLDLCMRPEFELLASILVPEVFF